MTWKACLPYWRTTVVTSPDADDALPDAVLDDVLPFDPHPASIPAAIRTLIAIAILFLNFIFFSSFYHQLFTDPSMIPLTKYF